MEVWDAIEPKKPENAVSVKKDKTAMAAIYHVIPEDVLLSIAEKKTVKEVRETLKVVYMGAGMIRAAKVQTLKAEFEILSMKESESSGKIANIVSNIRALGDTMEEAKSCFVLYRVSSCKLLPQSSNSQILKP